MNCGLNKTTATSPESAALSKDLRRRGFRFMGSQATGLVNDHAVDCFQRQPIIANYKIPA